jgi:hypothetical protein
MRNERQVLSQCYSRELISLLAFFTASIGQLASDVRWQPLLPPIAAGWSRKGALPTLQVLLVAKNSPAIAPTLNTITPPPSTLSLQLQHQNARAYTRLHKRITLPIFLTSSRFPSLYASGAQASVGGSMLVLLSVSSHKHVADFASTLAP